MRLAGRDCTDGRSIEHRTSDTLAVSCGKRVAKDVEVRNVFGKQNLRQRRAEWLSKWLLVATNI